MQPVRYLRHSDDGHIFEWDEQLAKHPKLHEVPAEMVYPERFAPKHVKQKVVKNKTAGLKPPVIVADEDEDEDEDQNPIVTDPDLIAEASANLP